jgi:hypothetical protein
MSFLALYYDEKGKLHIYHIYLKECMFVDDMKEQNINLKKQNEN